MKNYTAFPPKLPEHLVEILARYVGKKSAIGRNGLVARCQQRGFKTITERQIRECIKYLRRNGYLICSLAGTNGGYYMASSKDEFDEFDKVEFGAKIADMNETRQAMLKTADKQFSEFKQAEMPL